MAYTVDAEKVGMCADYTAAPAATVIGAAVDCTGYESIEFGVFFATPHATLTHMKAQQSSDNGATDAYSDIEDSSTADAGLSEQNVIQIIKPQKKWVRPFLTINAGGHGPIVYRLRGARRAPVTSEALGVVHVVKLVAPAEGTA